MPEILEVEITRAGIVTAIGRTIERVERTDLLVVGDGVDAAASGASIEGVGRVGKQLVLRTDHGDIGVHLGMTGRLLLGDEDPVGRLAYGSRGEHPVWDRWVVRLDDGRRLRLHDPRRLGRVVLDPPLDRFGPDALSLTARGLAGALGGRSAPVKAVLLDQQRIAGLGNLLVDEVLWRSGIDPRRPARSLSASEVSALQRTIRRRLPVMMRRGGSHTGTLSPEFRAVGGACPRCATPMQRATVGGRTTWWCPAHQV
ncbi:MAG: Fpg/Nei family DNA glycosylase [Desertimonas sp.]